MNRYVQYMYSYPHKTAYRPLENIDLRDYMVNLEGEGHGLYLHLPFCESKCGYCNLFSVTGCSQAHMDAYLEGVVRQMRQYREILPGSTVFSDFTIGGGTPLLLSPGQLEEMFRAAKREMPLGASCHVVIETAPKQTDREKARLLKALGVTRVSMGIQSFEAEELAWLGRRHDSRRAREAAGLLMETGFECVNFDFIYGLPGQTAESLLRSLRWAVSYSPEEIFLYPLYIKHGVRLERDGKKALLDPEHVYELYLQGRAFLKEQGYDQISMRRFVKRSVGGVRPEFQECGFTGALSLGCGGRSYLGRLHTCTPYRITRQEALEEIEAFQKREDFLSVSHGILLSEEELRRRYVIKHLLIRPGIPRQVYRQKFGREVMEEFPLLRTWVEQGWLEEKSDGQDVFLGLTEEGLGFSDYMGPQLISEEIGEKMLEWERLNGWENRRQENGFLQGESEKL